MIAKRRDRVRGPATSPRRAPGPPPPEDDIAVGTASRAGLDSRSGLVYSVEETARLTNPSCDQLYVEAGRRRLITRHHLQQFLGIAS